jgi:hypothetical protein
MERVTDALACELNFAGEAFQVKRYRQAICVLCLCALVFNTTTQRHEGTEMDTQHLTYPFILDESL